MNYLLLALTRKAAQQHVEQETEIDHKKQFTQTTNDTIGSRQNKILIDQVQQKRKYAETKHAKRVRKLSTERGLAYL